MFVLILRIVQSWVSWRVEREGVGIGMKAWLI